VKSQVSELARVARYLGALCRRKLTGELTLTDDTQKWKFYFAGGFLLYAVRETHRIRRWLRCVKHQCPELSAINPIPSDQCWEYQTLYRASTQEQLTPSQAKAILKESLEECLFPLIKSSNLTIAWKPIDYNSFNISPYLGLSAEEVRQTLKGVYQLYHQLQQMGLSYIFPEMAPGIKSNNLQQRFASESSLNLVAFLDGQNTIWDLVIITKQPLTVVSRLLHYLVQQGEIKIETVPDIALANLSLSLMSTLDVNQEPDYQPLIACIDDSPTVGKVLEEFLSSSGYRLLYIQNPLMGIMTLSENIPDLIFIDLIMPDTNGYNLCQFLRNSETFKDVPIIIMTSMDGVINRTRAKLVGARDFLSKPFTQDDILKMIQKYVNK
jgi:two-component system, chemotaxis family, response regulator PixG